MYHLFLEKMCGMILFDPIVGLKGQFDLELPLQILIEIGLKKHFKTERHTSRNKLQDK